ncbi:glycoside hydrolase family 79 protein [Gymnopilus junonius]|uniref:Glycoside hydrolase family 79 protein n=1 Tax=Gymnopilus junonius TaxID=109634 RepID=A0A9P5P4G5_GYMJU|nr:glycoside hydrolase family 79 protein [Gymnopilus junonius]
MLPSVTLFTLLIASFLSPLASADPIQVSIPSKPPSTHVVNSNFLGISFELSFLDEYFGNNTSTIPPTVINYLSVLHSRIDNGPVRMRIGGNSADDSTYVPTQTSAMEQFTSSTADSDDQPVDYGPVLWDVLNKVASDVGGAAYLIALSLRDPNSTYIPSLAADAAQKLGDTLDGFLLGNIDDRPIKEPDLYTSHGNRPNLKNYTTAIYMSEFQSVLNRLKDTSSGNILDKHDIGGPSICCDWSLDALINDGYTASFGNVLKYIALQHYPQNNCFGSYQFEIPYYVQHSNVVNLAAWQNSGIDLVLSSTGSNKQEVVMSEFNSASCGGIPGISNTFAVGSLWTVDYALQMASVGYSAAYLHTREQGISYNLFAPPAGAAALSDPWTTNTPFYSLLVTAEALRSRNGSIVTDLDINGSKKNSNVSVSGYAVYDAVDSTVLQLVFFNYANVSSSAGSSASFAIPSGVFSSSKSSSLTVKYLVGDSMAEGKNIAWGGETFANVSDGKPIAANASWAPANSQIECSNGCTINVPGPGMAVVFANGAPGSQTTTTTASGGSPTAVVKTASSSANNNIIYMSTVTLSALLTAFLV